MRRLHFRLAPAAMLLALVFAIWMSIRIHQSYKRGDHSAEPTDRVSAAVAPIRDPASDLRTYLEPWLRNCVDHLNQAEYYRAIETAAARIQESPKDGRAIAMLGLARTLAGFDSLADLRIGKRIDNSPLMTAVWAFAAASNIQATEGELSQAAVELKNLSDCAELSGDPVASTLVSVAATQFEGRGFSLGIGGTNQNNLRLAEAMAGRTSTGSTVSPRCSIGPLDFAMVTIGHQVYHFLVDTGTTETIITSGPLQGRIVPRQTFTLMNHVGGADFRAQLVDCPPMFLGGKLLSHGTCWMADVPLAEELGAPWVSGAIGIGHLEGLAISVLQEQIAFSTSPPQTREWDLVIPLQRMTGDFFGLYAVAVTLNGREELMLLDTGCAYAICTAQDEKLTSPAVTLGGTELRVTEEILYSDPIPSLGAGFLNQFDFCVDLIHHRLLLRRRGERD